MFAMITFQLQCCGLNSPQDYNYLSFVPQSCCAPNTDICTYLSNAYPNGCTTVLRQSIGSASSIFGITGFSVAGVLVRNKWETIFDSQNKNESNQNCSFIFSWSASSFPVVWWTTFATVQEGRHIKWKTIFRNENKTNNIISVVHILKSIYMHSSHSDCSFFQ